MFMWLTNQGTVVRYLQLRIEIPYSFDKFKVQLVNMKI